jgi:hypothetical protein
MQTRCDPKLLFALVGCSLVWSLSSGCAPQDPETATEDLTTGSAKITTTETARDLRAALQQAMGFGLAQASIAAGARKLTLGEAEDAALQGILGSLSISGQDAARATLTPQHAALETLRKQMQLRFGREWLTDYLSNSGRSVQVLQSTVEPSPAKPAPHDEDWLKLAKEVAAFITRNQFYFKLILQRTLELNDIPLWGGNLNVNVTPNSVRLQFRIER